MSNAALVFSHDFLDIQLEIGQPTAVAAAQPRWVLTLRNSTTCPELNGTKVVPCT